MLNYETNKQKNIAFGLLHNGDKLSQREFNKIYSKMPEPYRAELIAGLVYEPPPLSYQHSDGDSDIIALLTGYKAATPGTKAGCNATVILSDEDELQPDAHLRIKPENGGQTSYRRNLIHGAPELVAEVSLSSRSIDMHLKKERYARFGVKEYLVLCLEPNFLHLFDLEQKTLNEPDASGIIRSRVFPGLYINCPALLKGDSKAVIETLALGLASPEHERFKELLATQKR